LLAQSWLDADFRRCGFSNDVSAVLLVRGVVKGALLARSCGQVAEIAAMVVDEELRTGAHWANALLSCCAGGWMASAGIEILRFRCHPMMSREIRNFARRCGGRVVARQHARVFRLPAHEPALTT
jgi:hypothetical protein